MERPNWVERHLLVTFLIGAALVTGCFAAFWNVGSSASTPTPTPQPTAASAVCLTSNPHSGPVVIGATRATVYADYGVPNRTDAIGSISFADYQSRSAGFVLENGSSECDADRLMDMLIYAPSGETWTMSQATQAATALLPRDAEPVDSLTTYSIDGLFIDYRQRYRSASLAAQLPGDDRIYCGEDPDRREPAGTIWVKLNPPYDNADDIKDIQVTTQGC